MSYLGTSRAHWLAMLAKLTAPMESTAAAQAFAAYLPMIDDFPDWVFTANSLKFVSEKCHATPSYGQLVAALGEWWRANRPRGNELPAPEPYKPRIWTDEEKAAASKIVRQITAELRANDNEQTSRYAKGLPAYAERRNHLTRAELNEAYRRAGIRGPQVPSA